MAAAVAAVEQAGGSNQSINTGEEDRERENERGSGRERKSERERENDRTTEKARECERSLALYDLLLDFLFLLFGSFLF